MTRATTAVASRPLTRTTPMPPRPGGVAMATMVSLVENTRVLGAADLLIAAAAAAGAIS